MNTNELKAVLAATKEVAIYPTHILGDLPSYLSDRRSGRRLAVCPRGLVRATVVETRAAWTERRPVAECGDQDYDIPHRNGVLVELAADDLNAAIYGRKVYYKHKSGARSNVAVPYTCAVKRGGATLVQMVVSHRAIIAPWGEYALLEAQRERDEEERRVKSERVWSALCALMGLTPEQCRELPLSADYVEQYEYDESGNYKRDANGRRVMKSGQGRVQITVERAEELLASLTPKQKRSLGIPS